MRVGRKRAGVEARATRSAIEGESGRGVPKGQITGMLHRELSTSFARPGSTRAISTKGATPIPYHTIFAVLQHGRNNMLRKVASGLDCPAHGPPPDPTGPSRNDRPP